MNGQTHGALVFQLEDEFHAEVQDGEFSSYEQALASLQALVAVPFDQAPHCPPCTSAATCRRDWVINKFRVVSAERWDLVEQQWAATSTVDGVEWKT